MASVGAARRKVRTVCFSGVTGQGPHQSEAWLPISILLDGNMLLTLRVEPESCFSSVIMQASLGGCGREGSSISEFELSGGELLRE